MRVYIIRKNALSEGMDWAGPESGRTNERSFQPATAQPRAYFRQSQQVMGRWKGLRQATQQFTRFTHVLYGVYVSQADKLLTTFF